MTGPTGAQGNAGPTGPTGATGSTGAGGALGYYGLFISSTTQANAGTTTANLVNLDSTPIRANGVSCSSGTLTFAYAGKYQIITELAIGASTGTNPVVTVWMTQNGTNVPNSAQDFQLLGGSNTVQMSVCTWLLDIAAGDTVDVYWSSTNINTSLEYQGTLTSPTRPASPSASVNVAQVMYTQIGPTGPTGAQGNSITGPTGPTGPAGGGGGGTMPKALLDTWIIGAF